jgi:hypothetical protein
MRFGYVSVFVVSSQARDTFDGGNTPPERLPV